MRVRDLPVEWPAADNLRFATQTRSGRVLFSERRPHPVEGFQEGAVVLGGFMPLADDWRSGFARRPAH